MGENSLIAVARSWSNSDPENANAWAGLFPEGKARTWALTSTARKWAEVETAAARCLSRMEDRTTREEVFKNATSPLANVRPSLAEAWVNSISDLRLRAPGEPIVASKQAQARPQAGLPGEP